VRPTSSSIRTAHLIPGLVLGLALGLMVALAGPGGLAAAAAVGAVDDGAALMSEEQRARVAEHHGYLLQDHDIDYRVITARDIGDISQFAVVRFADLEVGQASSAGRGLLLVIDPDQDRVRLEVSYALEGVFPDAFVAYVEQRQMVPFFRAGRVADGILAATELIVTRAQRAAANAGFEGEVWMSGSGGGGATARADIGQGWSNDGGGGASSADPRTAAGRSPEETLQRYLGAMAARNGDPALALYTAATQTMLRTWVMTPAQMTNVAQTYRRCAAEPARTDGSGNLAVIRYPVSQRQCAPWFFRRAEDGWALDLTMMQTAIRFGRSNAWHFDLAADHPYRFAFADWRFDANGFPLAD
jgi:uncharacterized protein